MMKTSNLIVTQKDPRGIIRAVENDYFTWHYIGKSMICKATGRVVYQMALMNKVGEGFGSEPITDPEMIEAVGYFIDEMEILVLDAEEKAKTLQIKINQAEDDARYGHLTVEQMAAKAAQWDAINNEGGEGFNPYRI